MTLPKTRYSRSHFGWGQPWQLLTPEQRAARTARYAYQKNTSHPSTETLESRRARRVNYLKSVYGYSLPEDQVTEAQRLNRDMRNAAARALRKSKEPNE